MKFKEYFSNIKLRWIRRNLGVRTATLFIDAMIRFLITQVTAGLAIYTILAMASAGYMRAEAGGVGVVFTFIIFQLLCGISIIHEFDSDSMHYRLDQIIENTDTGVMNQLRALLDDLEKKNGLS